MYLLATIVLKNATTQGFDIKFFEKISFVLMKARLSAQVMV